MRQPGIKTTASILLASVLVVGSSCSKYQYVFISADLPQNDLKEYVVDNDTVSLRYSFIRQGIAATVSVENKLRQPLYIDYQRSVTVVNNEQDAGPFFADNQPSFIAPLSKVVIRNLPLRMSYIKMQADARHDEVHFGSGKGKKYSFDAGNTPLHFRHVLAITPNEDYSYPTFHDYSFWVETLIESYSGPKSAGISNADISYLHNSNRQVNITYWSVILAACLVPVCIGIIAAGI
ncbi:MAG: hypothetical protein MUD02_03385 [Bacteroidales bacterium]|jgi:hypothetical protein|nr:hypothetical protein [Bacteroidales bacterium]MCU0407971.1 hypothetical protein [Bacteroidales bacterium]